MLPEERVRQGLRRYMTEELGYPAELLVIEKPLNLLPHLALKEGPFPDRRVDLLAYWKNSATQELEPLLLIECKAVPFTTQAFTQLQGYNYYVKAPFIALVNQEGARLGWRIGSEFNYIDRLLSYRDLTSYKKDYMF